MLLIGQNKLYVRMRPIKATFCKNEVHVFGGTLFVKYFISGTVGIKGWEPLAYM